MHIAVLMGGWSAERPVSLLSGNGCADALEANGHRVTRIDMGRDVAARLAEAQPDLVFNALHGSPGEDGSVQGMLDLMGIPYTHSGLATSVIAIDKVLTKQVLVPAGIPMPGGRIVKSADIHERDPLQRPYVLKPINEGSSVGVAIVTDDGNYGNPIGRDVTGPWQEFDELLAEPYVRGRELTTAVLGERALGVTELKPKNGWYDFDAKYTDGLTEHVCPADIPDEIADACKRLALEAHRLLGCKGASRSDFRWDDERGVDGLFLLEVNTQPGMTPLSLVPEQARHIGMSYEQLVQAIVDEALAVGDNYFVNKCFHRLNELKERGVTILFVSHAAAIVTSLCSRALLLDKGRTLMLGEAEEVVNRYNQLIRERQSADVQKLLLEIVAGIEREAQAIAALSHPNICALHDVGPNYLVMEYIEGAPLKGASGSAMGLIPV